MSTKPRIFIHRGPFKVPPVERFWPRVKSAGDDECWEWAGILDEDGYGSLWGDSNQVRAHRFSYELHVGPIPEGLVLDHLCRNRACVNPRHLEPVTNEENVRRGAAARLEERGNRCTNGHRLTEDNVYRRPDEPTWVGCKACRSDASRRAAAKRPRVPRPTKLTEAAVVDILTSDATGRALAAKYGVTAALVSQVRLRRVWAHVQVEQVAS